VEAPNSASLQITDDISIFAWIKMDYPGETDQRVVVQKTGSYRLMVRHDPYRHIEVWLWLPEDGGAATLAGGPPISYNEWHMVGFTRNKTTGVVKTYVDGVEQASISGKTSPIPVNTNPVWIGKGWNEFDGIIDEVRIYNRALSAEEIRALYLAGKSRYSRSIVVSDKFRVFNSSLTETLRITASGNVGIGTTAPNQKLTVAENSAMSFTLGGLPNPIVSIGTYGTNPSNGLGFFVHDTATGYIGWVGAIRPGNENCGGWGCKTLRIQVPSNTGSVVDAISIAGTTGNVGIGTTSPAYKLDVAGDIRATGNYYIWDDSSNNRLLGRIDGWSDYLYIIASQNAAGSGIIFRTTPSGGSETDRMIIDKNGNVGIGTTTGRAIRRFKRFLYGYWKNICKASR